MFSGLTFDISGTSTSVLRGMELHSTWNRTLSPKTQDFSISSHDLFKHAWLVWRIQKLLQMTIFQGSPEVAYLRVFHFSHMFLTLYIS